jgi:hypothetical protein
LVFRKKQFLFDFRLHDIILRVNEMDFTHIEHQAAVDGLKAAGNHVSLVSFLLNIFNKKCFVVFSQFVV